MLATPLCILLTLLAADPTGNAAMAPPLEGARTTVLLAKATTSAPAKKATPSKKVTRKKVRANKKVTPSKKVTPGKKVARTKPAAKKVAHTQRPAKKVPKKVAKKSGAASKTASASAKSSGRPKSAVARSKAARKNAGASKAPGRAAPSDLSRARELLRAVKQDPERRRYRHHWEKAIGALERAAKGRDRAAALLDAARARYALYRFSADEADRDRALALARKAGKLGAGDAKTFIAAVRREAGDDQPQQQRAVAKPAEIRNAPASGVRQPPSDGDHAEEVDEPPDTDPVLDRILAQLAEDPPETDSVIDKLVGQLTADDPRASEPSKAVPAGPTASRPAPAPLESLPPAPERTAVASAPAVRELPRLAPTPADNVRGPIRKIVIDPGHGGHDSGAIGPSRVREKDVVLAISKRLARKLRAEGFEVVLTREDDRYLALAERTALANAHQGDLFVSVHANAHPRRDRQGVETWVLDVNSDRYASRLAARENGILDGAESPLDVRRILADLDAKVSAQASRRLAQVVQQEVTTGIRGRFGPVRDLGVKSALFYVLLGARMPAVLVETSFISNRAEEKRLKSPKFQEEVASALVRAIGTFAAQQSRIAAR